MNIKYQRLPEHHLMKRSNWVRAAVLGANDGILSIASIVSGVAAGGGDHGAILLAGLAGLAAGATAMAAGEYVSVSSQTDIETADLAREKHELTANPGSEQEELAHIYIHRGLDFNLAHEVARQLMSHDALGAHARDELGISELNPTNPLQAALSSAASFTLGALLPLLMAILVPVALLGWLVFGITLVALALLGLVAALTGGSPVPRAISRVVLWGALSMSVTTLIGKLCGAYL